MYAPRSPVKAPSGLAGHSQPHGAFQTPMYAPPAAPHANAPLPMPVAAPYHPSEPSYEPIQPIARPHVSPGPSEPVSKVCLRFKGRSIVSKDLFSPSDPFLVIYMRETVEGGWFEMARTETINNNANPEWSTAVDLDFFFERTQQLRLEAYDRDSPSERLTAHDYIGHVEISLSELMATESRRLIKSLRPRQSKAVPSEKLGTLEVHAEESLPCADVMQVQFAAEHLDNTDSIFGRSDRGWFGGKSDPFVEIRRLICPGADPANENNWVLVWQGDYIKNDLNPSWRPVKLELRKICNGDHRAPLKLRVMDWEASGIPQFIGECVTSVDDMQQQRSFKLINQERKKRKGSRYSDSGVLKIKSIDIVRRHSFAEYLKGGCEVSLIVGIDFTQSNGLPTDQRSLHYIDHYHGRLNQYQSAILAAGSVLEAYDHDKKFPVYGFGARINGQLDDCFPLNFNVQYPEVAGVKGMIEAYNGAVSLVELFGPTNFAPLIRQSMRIATTFSVDPTTQKYFILLILTDGAITDMPATKRAIVEASRLPLSIVIVGVGDFDFSAMKTLDSDDKLLRDDQGQCAERDIVQFVPFQKYSGNSSLLARETLAEIPHQVEEYFEKRRIRPLGKANYTSAV